MEPWLACALGMAVAGLAGLAGWGLGYQAATRALRPKLDALLIAQGFEPHDLEVPASLAGTATWLHRHLLRTNGSPTGPRPRQGTPQGTQGR